MVWALENDEVIQSNKVIYCINVYIFAENIRSVDFTQVWRRDSADKGGPGACPGKLKTRAAGMERAKRVSVPKARVVSLSK